jgi:3-oxoacyl-[acyl-carrier protein] reductase
VSLAVVSGGTRGIGLALSRRLMKLGHRVVALYHSDDAGARAAASEGLHVLRMDVANPDSVAQGSTEILTSHGAPAVLVNNAGINVDKPFLSMTTQDWQRVVDTNLSGVFHLCRALVPAMLDEGGVVVNIGATTGIRPRLNGANYCASKAGLLQLTKCLALELAPRVRVNCLIPGMTETEELVTRFRLDDPASRAQVLDAIPQRRIGAPEDVADALEFLVSPSSAMMTGQKLIVDGGEFML